MSRIFNPSKVLATAAILAFAAAGSVATAGSASAANAIVGQTNKVCTTNQNGLALRDEASPTATAIEHLENGWGFYVYRNAANGMVYGHSWILNMNGYVDDGHFC